MISGNGFLIYTSVCVCVCVWGGGGVRFADFISFSQISHENEIIWSH